METAISTTRLHSLSGSLPSLAGIFIIPPVVHSFIMLCHAPSSCSHACHFFHTRRQTGRLIRAFSGYLLQPCVTFSTVPSSEVCTFNLRKTQNKQQPGQLFSSSFCFFPAKFLIFCFSLLFPTYLLGLWSIVVISPGLTTRCCSGRSVLAKVWFDDGEVVSQSVTNE